jgi:hypothetical protein
MEHGHPKSGKTKLHLLNPMSLLARRRSSQPTTARQDDVNFGGPKLVPAIPDDYDPRIRGSIVHDFSAPRPRRHVPGGGKDNTVQQNSVTSSSGLAEQHKRHSEHSPVFTEDFGEDRRVLQIESKGYLQSSLMTSSVLGDHDSKDLPAFARKLPLRVPENGSQPVKRTVEISAPLPKPTKQSPPRAGSNGSADTPQPVSSVPNRLKSDASRFSFDMSGVGSSVQEKLLEEKHKEKEAARKENARKHRSSYSDYDDEDFDYDAIEDDGGFEERIPGINADASDDDDEFRDFAGVVKTTHTSLFVPVLPAIAASPISPADSHMGMQNTPRDFQGNAIGFATTSDSPYLLQRQSSSDYGDADKESEVAPAPSTDIVIGAPPDQFADSVSGTVGAEAYALSGEDDDLYFDDGDFDELPADMDHEGFDESVFDDETSQLYDRAFYPGTRIPVTAPTLPGPEDPLQSVKSEDRKSSDIRHVPSLASDFRPDSWSVPNGLSSRFSGAEPPKTSGGVLSEHNLEAFHSALARVADEVAASKQLQRNLSLSEMSLGQDSVSQTADSHPDLLSDDSRLSQTAGLDAVLDDFDYDDDGLDDDLIIAEANAEALENDDEGFYGEEFGFYAHSDGSCNGESVYGGYFGPRGVEGISRSHSGRAVFCEPSLTPITERSEWSTRNSIASLTTHGAAAPSNPSLTAPGLAQLVDMGNLDDEMTLEALMKLRRGAFGGSNGSLRSSTSSPSPQTAPLGASNRISHLSIPEDSPMALNTSTSDNSSHLADSTGALSSGHYISSPLSEGDSQPGSPTLTFNHMSSLRRGSSGDAGDVGRGTGKSSKPSHSRASSSASISYVQETAEDGSSKWVLERRRTGDSGSLEVYEREVLEDGRI